MRSAIRRLTATTAALAALGAAGLFISAAPAAAWAAGGNTSNYGPALVECQNPLNSSQYYEWIAFTGTDGQINLMDYNFNEGYSATTSDSIIAQYLTGYYAVGAPALACDAASTANTLVVAWRNSSNQIVLADAVASNGRIVLSNVRTWGETTDASPSIAGTHDAQVNEIVVGWAGTDGSHHINLAFANPSTLTEGGKYTTTDYTRSGAGLGVGQYVINGPFGDGFYVGWLASSGTPYIYMGYFPPSGTTSLQAVRTTDYSPYAPSVSQTRVLWKGYTNNYLYAGVFNGTSNLNGSAPYTDQTLGTPAADGTVCSTAYTGTDQHIYYDTHDFLNC